MNFKLKFTPITVEQFEKLPGQKKKMLSE